MQKELDPKIWEEKDIRSARQSAVKASSSLVEAFVNAGFYENKEKALDDFHGFKNMIFDYIYAEMKQHIKTDFETPKQENEKREGKGDATEKQRKAVFAIVFGSNGDPELAKELTVTRETLNELTFEEASEFIDKYGFKK